MPILTPEQARSTLLRFQPQLAPVAHAMLRQIVDLLDATGQTTVALVLAQCYRDKSPAAATKAFERLRDAVNEAAETLGDEIRLEVDARKALGDARAVYFRGEPAVAVHAVAEELAAVPRVGKLIEQDAVWLRPKTYPGVMLSSTFRDLVSHRAHLLTLLPRYELMQVAMENTGAVLNGDVVDSSLRMVRDAAGYICITGYSYGQIPKCARRNPQRFSLTELEFREAQRLKRPIALFIMGANHSVPMGAVNTNAADRARLKRFIDYAKCAHADSTVHRVYAVFNSIEEFATECQVLLPKLALLLQADHGRSGTAPTQQAQSQELTLCADTEDLRKIKILVENHARRVGLNADQLNANAPAPDAVNAFEQLTNWAKDPAKPAHFALLGEYGMGKTVLCQRLCGYLTDQRANGIALPRPLYFDLRRMPARTDERVPSLEDTLEGCVTYGWLSAPGAAKPSVDQLKRWVTEGALVVFDGLDEVLVHLSAANGQQYTSQLLRLLDLPRAASSPAPKMLLSCRSHFFKSLSEQRAMLMERGRSKLDTEQFEALLLLPFTDAQVEDYLQSALPDLNSAQAMATIRALHNVSELAARPYLLKEVARLLPLLEQWRMQGRKVQGVTVYREMVHDWLLRDTGKHQIAPEHKLLVARDLAAELWRRGSRMIDASAMSSWYYRWRQNQADIQLRYTHVHVDKLDEDLRNSQFLVREDDESVKQSGFRFAHSSMQEYFLADYLLQAVRDNVPERWAIKAPSVETLGFLAQLLTEYADENLLSTLSRWRAPYRKQASELYLHYALLAYERSWPLPSLHGLDMRGASLRRLKFGKRPQSDQPRLALEQVRFDGAALTDCQFRSVRLHGAQFAGADLSGASLIDCAIDAANFNDADLSGTIFRRCAGQASTVGARLYRTQWQHALIQKEQEVGCHLVPDPTRKVTQQSQLVALHGHSGAIAACELADGTRALSASWDHTLRLWDLATGETLRVLEGHISTVSDCQFSGDGTRALSASWDNTLRLWDISTGETLRVLEGHTSNVNACQLSADGVRALSASRDHTLRLWDLSTGETLHVLEGHTSAVNACQLSANGIRALSASRDHTLRLWDLSTGKTLRVLRGHANEVSDCQLSADGMHALSASWDNTVRVWDLSTGETLRVLGGHTSIVNVCQLSADGSRALSASQDHTLRLWDLVTGETLGVLKGYASEVLTCQLSADSIRALSTSWDDSLRLWDLRTGEILRVLKGHASEVIACHVFADGTRALSAGWDDSLRLWDLRTGEILRVLQGHASDVHTCHLSADGTRVLWAINEALSLWDLSTGETLRVLEGHTSEVTACHLSADGTRALSASNDHTLRLWDLSTGETLQVLEGHASEVSDCHLSADGTRALSASDDNTLRLWDLSTGETLRVLEGHGSEVTACHLSADGTRALSASDDNTLRLWDLNTGETLRVLEGHASEVSDCKLSADGTRALSGSWDHTLRLWDLSTGETLCVLKGHTSEVNACQLFVDGTRALSASDDNTMRLWDLTTGETLRVYLALDSGTACFDPRPIRDADDHTPRLIHATGEIWRHLAWQVPTADGGWERVPLETFGDVVQDE